MSYFIKATSIFTLIQIFLHIILFQHFIFKIKKHNIRCFFLFFQYPSTQFSLLGLYYVLCCVKLSFQHHNNLNLFTIYTGVYLLPLFHLSFKRYISELFQFFFFVDSLFILFQFIQLRRGGNLGQIIFQFQLRHVPH